MNVMADVSPFVLIVHYFGYGASFIQIKPIRCQLYAGNFGLGYYVEQSANQVRQLHVICCLFFKMNKY